MSARKRNAKPPVPREGAAKAQAATLSDTTAAAATVAEPVEPPASSQVTAADVADGATPADGATAAEAAAPRRSGAWLPWSLVALLTAACVLLATLYGNARQRVHELEARPTAAASVGSSAVGSPTPNAAAISAAPTTGPSAAQLLALQRRQPTDQLALGKADAPIVLIEWADFRCPYCAAWNQQTLPQLVPYIKSGSLRVEFHDLVIFGDESTAAAKAARAAGIQGHFWDYSQLLWALHTGNGHPEISDQMLQDFASKAGVADVAKFNADRNSQAVADAVAQDTQQATQMGLKATPFFLVNTTQIPGAYPASTFTGVIEQYGGKPAQ